MPEALGFTRAVHIAMSLSLFGAFLFRAAIAPAAIRCAPAGAGRALHRRLDALMVVSLVTALASSVALLMQQAIAMSGADDLIGAVQASGPALVQTQFGHVLLMRTALLLTAALCLWPRAFGGRRWAMTTGTVLAGAAVVLMAATGHAAAMEGTDRLLSMVVQAAHLAAAGAWLGGLVPLALTLTLPSSAAGIAVRRFSPLGIICVTVLALTAWFNARMLIGSVPALFGTPYGHWALAKLALFAAMVALAAANRFWFTPGLAGLGAAAATKRLRVSVAAETTLGLAVIMAAGMLATTPPGIHAQPWWPFPFRLSLAALQEQPEFYRTMSLAVIAAAAGVMLIVTGVQFRRWRWPIIVVGLMLLGVAAPGFRPLAVDAFPTTYWRSPTGYSVQSLAHGARLFGEHCSGCHGPRGRGDGPIASRFKPPDLTAEYIDDHLEGDVFWRISQGVADRGMPGFAATLDEMARWSLIDFIHANADATRLTSSVTGAPTRRISAPDFAVECPDGSLASLRDLFGRVVHLVFVGPGSAARLRQLAAIEPLRRKGGITTVVVARDIPGEASEPFCTAMTPDIAEAYAMFGGGDRGVAGMDGTEFLIDSSGALRAIRRPGEERVWSDPMARSEIDVFTPPVAAPQH